MGATLSSRRAAFIKRLHLVIYVNFTVYNIVKMENRRELCFGKTVKDVGANCHGLCHEH